MEVFFARFSHLTEAIFDHLDAVNLAKCREVSWDWQEYLAEKRFLHIRVIRSLIGNVGQPWERFFKSSDTLTISPSPINSKKKFLILNDCQNMHSHRRYISKTTKVEAKFKW